MLTDIIALAPPWIFGEAIGIFGEYGSGSGIFATEEAFFDQIFRLSLLLLLFGVLLATFRYLWRRISFDTSRLIEYDLRDKFLSHLLKLSPGFFDNAKVGDLISRASYDIQMIRMFLSIGLVIVTDVITIELVTIPILLYLNWKLTLILLIPLPLIGIFTTRLIRRLHSTARKVQDHTALLSTEVQEYYSGARVLKSFNREETAYERFKSLSSENVAINIDFAKTRGLFIGTVVSISILVQVLFLLFGGRGVIFGELAFKDFVKFDIYLIWVTMPMAYLGWAVNLYQRGVVSMERLKEIFDAEPDIVDGPNVDSSITCISGAIEFKGLSFSYDKEEVLHDINLKIESGKTIAIVGPVGSGKSTLVHLIPRLYNPPAGSLFIDGRDIFNIPIDILRRHIGFVSQEPLLFSETIAGNIAFGKEDSSAEEIEKAAESSGVHREIMEFEKQYDTLLGERGVNISGGQKQRTTIARALAIDPAILILDDALASVDTQTEEEILKNLRDFRKGRTCLIISHRVSSVKDADMIVVLAEGRIVERGTHESLIGIQGYYYDLYRRQQLKRELEEEAEEEGK